MNKKVIIFGNTHFSRIVAQYVIDYSNLDIYCFTVDKEYLKEDHILDIPVIPFEDIVGGCHVDDYSFLITLGYANMNKNREDIYYRIKNLGYSIESFIHPESHIHTEEIGEGCVILDNVYIGYNSQIGICNIIWDGAHIGHDTSIGNFNHLSSCSAIGGNSVINDNCFLGINCTIVNGTSIENNTLIGAHCCITHNTKCNEAYCSPKNIAANISSDKLVYFV